MNTGQAIDFWSVFLDSGLAGRARAPDDDGPADMLFPPADCQAEWRLIPDVEFRPIQTIDGHLALFGADPNAISQLDKHLGELLAIKI